MEEGEQRTRQPEFAKVFLIDRGQLFQKKIHLHLDVLLQFLENCLFLLE